MKTEVREIKHNLDTTIHHNIIIIIIEYYLKCLSKVLCEIVHKAVLADLQRTVFQGETNSTNHVFHTLYGEVDDGSEDGEEEDDDDDGEEEDGDGDDDGEEEDGDDDFYHNDDDASNPIPGSVFQS